MTCFGTEGVEFTETQSGAYSSVITNEARNTATGYRSLKCHTEGVQNCNECNHISERNTGTGIYSQKGKTSCQNKDTSDQKLKMQRGELVSQQSESVDMQSLHVPLDLRFHFQLHHSVYQDSPRSHLL